MQDDQKTTRSLPVVSQSCSLPAASGIGELEDTEQIQAIAYTNMWQQTHVQHIVHTLPSYGGQGEGGLG